ncbi:hypothetical protein A6A28_02290 [Streptomyces sp. CB03578]|nr:hypothetical protein A6A28_02290 [Streptomyces sp. CB03578]
MTEHVRPHQRLGDLVQIAVLAVRVDGGNEVVDVARGVEAAVAAPASAVTAVKTLVSCQVSCSATAMARATGSMIHQ